MNRTVLVLCGLGCLAALIISIAAMYVYQNDLVREDARIKAEADRRSRNQLGAAEARQVYIGKLSTYTMYGTKDCDEIAAKYASDTDKAVEVMSFCQPYLHKYYVNENDTVLAKRATEKQEQVLAAQAKSKAHIFVFVYPALQISVLCTLAFGEYLLYLRMAIVIEGTQQVSTFQGPTWWLYAVYSAFAIGLPTATLLDLETYLDWIQASGCRNSFNFDFYAILKISGCFVWAVGVYYGGPAFTQLSGLGVNPSSYLGAPAITAVWEHKKIWNWFSAQGCLSTSDICVACNLTVLIIILALAYSSHRTHKACQRQAACNVKAQQQQHQLQDSSFDKHQYISDLDDEVMKSSPVSTRDKVRKSRFMLSVDQDGQGFSSLYSPSDVSGGQPEQMPSKVSPYASMRYDVDRNG